MTFLPADASTINRAGSDAAKAQHTLFDSNHPTLASSADAIPSNVLLLGYGEHLVFLLPLFHIRSSGTILEEGILPEVGTRQGCQRFPVTVL